ncbi:RecQ family ATP-dependent DNA helicase [Radiobacillus sp. PE A8.2]|uniref:RecQ family ATP-dependent DNA helicase n=1 Tax=Radiobacillus sp. PE A8.2 TaxID=3380349 RepID=UPI00388E9350
MIDQLDEALKKHYHFASFRTGQKEIIEDLVEGNNVLGILPTGSGKSLCYQLPARITGGTVLVVSPLISLMIDQVKQLKATGFKEVVAINSFLNASQKQQVINQIHDYKLIYVSPEMLQNKHFIKKLMGINISLFVVDEAHCISQWGHEFRPDYLKLGEIIQKLAQPTILALSATATPEVQEDIIRQLGYPFNKHIYPMDRDNIALSVQHMSHDNEKLDYIVDVLSSYSVSTMIYFSSRNWTEKAAAILEKELSHLRIAFYHGGMEQADRILIQQQYMNNQLDVVCCTSAFGMGINKMNIRLVIHFHLPTQIESFIQEIGRAGRDGKSSVSLVLLSPSDEFIPKKLISMELPSRQLIETIVYSLKANQGNNSIDPLQLQAHFELNEIQWRFLHYQFEKYGMLNELNIVPNFDQWESLIETISERIDYRNQYKYKKLAELFAWATSNDVCRRSRLFSAFQDTIKEPKYLCCDRCDFSFTKWNPESLSRKERSHSWQETLKLLLLQGGKHEF